MITCLLKCSKNTATYTHYFALYRLSLFHFDIFIIYVSYSYSAGSWLETRYFNTIENQFFLKMLFTLQN